MATWFDAAGFGYQEFSAGGVRTFAIVEGQQSAFPLLLLHGIPGASFVWSTLISTIGRGRRIVALDLPSWGRSRDRGAVKPPTLSQTFLREWLANVIRAQQLAEFDIVGLGDGAWLAVDALLGHGSQIRRLGLINLPLVSAETRGWNWFAQRNAWDRRRLAQWVARNPALGPVTAQFDELLSGEWHADRSPEFPRRYYLNDLAGYAEALGAFKGETFLAWGQASTELESDRAAALTGARTIVMWPGAGSFPMWETPEQFHKELMEFLQS